MEQITITPSISLLSVCVDRFERMEMKGRLVTRLSGSLPFEGVIQLMEALQDSLDKLQFPQNTHEIRSFRRRKTGPERGQEGDEAELASAESILEARGKKATFVVQVKFRQNASWQGTVHWVDTDQKQNFRSTLELIKLMDEALESQEEIEFAEWQTDD